MVVSISIGRSVADQMGYDLERAKYLCQSYYKRIIIHKYILVYECI